jgi:hypothetical protein
MTELHNMSVPPRSVLTVQRAELSGQRYRVAIGAADTLTAGLDAAALTRCFREHGAACAWTLLHAGKTQSKRDFMVAVARRGRDPNAAADLRQLCDRALRALCLPDGFGFFVEEARPDDPTVPGAAALAILAARSGPLYVPGRFEPSLITAGEVTVFFPKL